MANNKQFVVIGLGRFGESVAKTLYSLGHDVLVIDMDEDSIQEISDTLGYATVSHFIKEFKKRYGYSPLKFRKLLK